MVEIATSAWETAKILIADDRVKTAKEIAELAGIIGGPIFGLYHLTKWLRGKKIESVTVVKVSDGKNLVEIKVEGDPDIKEISQSVYELYANVSTRKKALDVLSPLREEGYETLEFYDEGGVFVHFGQADVPKADFSDLPEVIPQNENKSIIRTGVRIRKAAYEGASKWTLMYKRAIEASIDDTEWLAQFQSGEEKAPPGSSLDVDLEEIFITNENGEMIGEPSYRVLKVHSVALPDRQKTLRFTGIPENG